MRRSGGWRGRPADHEVLAVHFAFLARSLKLVMYPTVGCTIVIRVG